MCYYNGIKVSRLEFIQLVELEKSLAEVKQYMKPVQTGFEYGESVVIVATPDKSDIEVTAMQWGFIPSYLRMWDDVKKMRFGYKDPAGKFHPPLTTLNAIGEEMLLPRKMFRDAALQRRCLVLSTGIYEWRHVPAIGKKGQVLKTMNKFPYHISLKEEPYFYMAGIWQPWTDKETGELVNSFAIVTTEANPLMAAVHNIKKRMPVIFTPDLAKSWIMDDLIEARIQELARFQYPHQEMQACPISKEFREAIDPTEQFSYEDLPALAV